MMHDKTILITGGTGGIGKQTALALAKMGAQVIVTGRSRDSAEAAIHELKDLSGNPQVDMLLADLATHAGVRSLAEQFQQKYPKLDVLINNAGRVESQRILTEDGIEVSFAVNVVAPFLLTQFLMNSLQASGAGRVITLTGGSVPGKIDLDNLQGERSYEGLTFYSQTKVTMMAVMYEYAQRVNGANVTINVCYPGTASTSMTQSVTPEMVPLGLRLIWPVFKLMLRPDNGKSAAKASRSSVYLASSAEVANVNGTYFDTNCKIIGWPQAVLDPAVRQAVWSAVTQSIRTKHAGALA